MMHTRDALEWRQRAEALAAELAEAGVLTDPRWRAALEETPRHVFVPRFYDHESIIDNTNPAWLDAVYRDETLVTQQVTVPGMTPDLATSSSTRPSMMIRMLELLAVTGSSRVLEIGTATGYNAALLCHRLGEDQVASIELHPVLAAEAAEHLRRLGYHPRLAVGDGAVGLPAEAPYDRIIATCATSAIPPAWIEQLTPGGRIVADLRSEISSSIVTLDKIDDVTVRGRLLEQPGHFMWLRPELDNPFPGDGRVKLVVNLDDAHSTPTDLDPAVLDNPGLRVLLGILDPTLWVPFRSRRDDTRYLVLRASDGAWAEVTLDGQPTVTQAGPRDLWPTVEHAVAQWQRLGRPERGRYGVTITGDGTHRYWLDHPDRPIG